MIRGLIILLVAIGAETVHSQTLYTAAGSVLHTNSGATLSVNGPATMVGSLSNLGQVDFRGDVIAASNSAMGSASFTGGQRQEIWGDSLVFNDFEVNMTDRLAINASSVTVAGKLKLERGIVESPLAPIILKSTGALLGGSRDSFLEGTFSWSGQFFPLGLDGRFNPLTLTEELPKDAALSIAVVNPDPLLLVPGDSLTGMADDLAWEITLQGENDWHSRILTEFNGIDLNSLVNASPIKAHQYSPVLTQYYPPAQRFLNMGVGSLTQTDSVSFGVISSEKALRFRKMKTELVAIGQMPHSNSVNFYVPNVFSPGSSLSENRTFKPFISGSRVENVTMRIWDAFNNELFRTDVDSPGSMNQVAWNGKSLSGDIADQGLYYFSVVVSTVDGNFQKTGSFLLVH